MKLSDVIGVLLVLLGGIVMLGWWLHLPLVARVLPDLPPMVFNAALGFTVAGAALLLIEPGSRHATLIATAAGGLLAMLAVLALVEQFFRLDLGIDEVQWHAWLGGAGLKPGRMSAGTSSAFLMAGAALVLGPRVRGRRMQRAVTTLTWGTGVIGVLGLAGHLVNATLLFPNYAFVDVSAHSAFGLFLLAIGMASMLRRFEWGRLPLLESDHDRITLVGATILVAVALCAGIALFAILQGRFQTLIRDSVVALLNIRREAFEDFIALREINARIAATRPAVLRNLRIIQDGRDDGSNIANVQAVVDGLLHQGFSGLAYHGIDGKIIASAGVFAQAPAMTVPLATPDRAELIWDRMFLVRHRIELRDGEQAVGTVLVEQPLPILTRLAREMETRGETWDMGLCVMREQRLVCFPQRLNPQVFSMPQVNVADIALPMTRALNGETGSVITRDYRAQNVVAAFGPVGQLGLGMVVKVDTAEVFRPIREQLLLAIGLLSFFAAGGALLLRRRILPLVSKLVDAQAHARTQELRLQEQNVQLTKVNKAKDDFLANMSHELRTPLNAILGFTDILLMKLPGPLTKEQEKQLSTVQASARHLLALINDLLDIGKIGAGKFEPNLEWVDCNALVEEVAVTLRPQADRKGLQVSVDTPKQPVLLSTDRRALSQIVINLMGNAIKFTDHGRVQLKLSRNLDGSDNVTQISVTDSGPGIPREDQDKLFGAYSRVSASRPRNPEGTGLGLHLSQQLAAALGGRIVVDSDVGIGSTFTLVLRGKAAGPAEP